MSSAALRQHTNKDLGDFKFGTKNPCSIHVHVVEAQNLMSADANGFSDPYCKLSIPSSEEKKIKGPTISKTLDPVFDWQTTFNLKDSTCTDLIKIKIYDYDRASRDDPLGLLIIPLVDLGTIGIISGWFYLQSPNKAKKGQEIERSHGRVYVRIIGDKYCKPYEKANPQALVQRRAQLLDLVRLVEAEHNNTLAQRINFEFRQEQKKLTRQQTITTTPEDEIPPPPPSSVLDGLAAYQGIVYHSPIPEAKLPDPAAYSSSPCFICSPLQHPQLPAVPIAYVSSKPLSSLQTMGVDTTAEEITQNDVSVPLVAYQLKLCCCAWNVGNAPPSDPHLLREWLRDDCDIYVVGTQENHYQPRKGYKTCSDDFNATLLAALGPQYTILQQEDLGEIHIVLIVKRSIRCYVDVLQAKKATEATGMIGILPNKGGAAISVNILGTSFCFVSSHLAAHAHKSEKRDDDMRSIVRGIQYTGQYAQTSILNSFQHTFWFGDLNYRLKYAGESQEPDPVKFNEMLELINAKDYETLLATDQLLWDTIQNRTAFVGFNDCPINFPPTFKVKKGDLQRYDPLRAPSYTDRVLWRSQTGYERQVQFVSFQSASCVTSSDHKPVSAVFNIYPSTPVCALSPCIHNLRFVPTSISIVGLPAVDITTKSSDPYVKFSSPNLKDSVKTPYRRTTLTPSWDKGDLAPLEFKTTSEGRLWETMINITVFDYNDLASSTLLSSGVLSFKSEDIVQLLHHSNATIHDSPSSPILSSPSSPLPTSTPSSPGSFRFTRSLTGLMQIEIDRVIQLYASTGTESGVMKIKGYLEWERKERISEYSPANLTSIQGMKK